MEHRPRKAIFKEHEMFSCAFTPLALFCLVILVCGCSAPLALEAIDAEQPGLSVSWPKAIRIIRGALADSDPLVRARAIEVVASTRQLKLMPQVLRLMQDDYVPVRFAAALAVGDLEYSPGREMLRRLLKDGDMNVVTAAAYGLVKLGSSEHLGVLREAASHEYQTVRANAVFLLGKSGDRGSLQILWNTMQDKSSEHKVAYQAAEAIARLGDKRIFSKLWAMLISAYADVRVMGVRAMGKLQTAEAKNALIRMLDDDVPEVRLAAAEQLGSEPIGEAEVLEVFEKNLTSGLDLQAAERINVLTALAIGKVRTPALKKFLPRLLENDSIFVRIAAAKAVFQCLQ
jgi:HEAT repeat protein